MEVMSVPTRSLLENFMHLGSSLMLFLTSFHEDVSVIYWEGNQQHVSWYHVCICILRTQVYAVMFMT